LINNSKSSNEYIFSPGCSGNPALFSADCNGKREYDVLESLKIRFKKIKNVMWKGRENLGLSVSDKSE
jgi:hypothetical protein